MNHYLATYIDFIQSFGFILIIALGIFVFRKLVSDNNKDNYIKVLKIRVDK